jgi:hypothetical protein
MNGIIIFCLLVLNFLSLKIWGSIQHLEELDKYKIDKSAKNQGDSQNNVWNGAG